MGLKKQLLKVIEHIDYTKYQQLILAFNIDGVPLFKSTKESLWPILCSVKNIGNIVFPVSLVYGPTKPTDQLYCRDFINELKCIIKDGLTIDNHRLLGPQEQGGRGCPNPPVIIRGGGPDIFGPPLLLHQIIKIM